jgi:UDP-GlcNAc3NAcA epimerase
MSQVFFDQMNIPKPHYHLGVASSTHAKITGEMQVKIEKVLMKESPDWAVVFGDTNTTLAGAFAAAKIPLPIAHVEAGLRSFNWGMPEEINRVVTDRISSALFCPTETAVQNLRKEGITRDVFQVGDVMYDAFLEFKEKALSESEIQKKFRLQPKNYCLATIHRQENTENVTRLANIFRAFDELAEKRCLFIVPLHPRTRKKLNEQERQLTKNPNVRLINPVHYLDMLALESQARVILTDSGGIQKEAFFVRVPCITMRNETEWVETVEAGWNSLAGADTEKIITAFHRIERVPSQRKDPSHFYGEGNAGRKIVDLLISISPYDLRESKSLPLRRAESKKMSKKKGE